MDPFDEFEMKPLTSGLGFHKKAVNLGEEVKKAKLTEDTVRRSVPSSPPEDLLDVEAQKATDTLDELLASLKMPEETINEKIESRLPDLEISEPLPRKDLKRRALDIEPAIDPISQPEIGFEDETIVEEAPRLRHSVGTRRSGHSSPIGRLVARPMSFASATLDSLVVLALSLVFLLSLLLVTKVNLLTVYRNAQNDFLTQLSVVALYLAVMQIYVVISRSFFGKTLAEWTFDLQMGDDEQQKKAIYPLLILWRSLVVTLTGVVILPLLSFITRKDIASYFTGLQLYRKK